MIKSIIQNDFLVDDLLTGSDSKDELLYIKNSIERILSTACFPLRKYRSNSSSILNDDQGSNPEGSLIISSSSHILGVGWDSSADIIHFPIQYTARCDTPTKRSILSDSCKIFDPLGQLCLLTIIPKILIQRLWLAKLDWDEPVPYPIREAWQRFADGLSALSSIRISRNVLCDSPNYIELHCFCDSSASAYASCIYLKSISDTGKVVVRLLCAKARVSPATPTTIPRLELCAAVLGAQLTAAVVAALRCQIRNAYYWTDSTIVLAWLQTSHTKLNTFVSNRTSKILELTEGSEWRHVPTDLNPADFASRGVDAGKLCNLEMWWNGPAFLYKTKANWPALNTRPCDEIPELKINRSA